MLKKISLPPLFLWSACILILGHLFIFRLIQNSLQSLWLDESIIIFISNHPLLSKSFGLALKENVAGMPWPFIEYHFYLQFLKMFPLQSLMDHVEFFARLPLIFYSMVTMTAGFLMVRRLSQSTLFAIVTTFFIYGINFLSTHLGSELRFHTSAMMHITLSWMFLAFLIMETHAQRQRKWWIIWMISATLAGWSHLYGIYSVVMQLATLVLIRFLNKEKIGWPTHNGIFAITIGSLSVMVMAQVAFYQFCTIHPYLRNMSQRSWPALWEKTLIVLNQKIFVPNVFIWLAIFLLVAILTILHAKLLREKIYYSLVGILGILQLVVMAILSILYFYWAWGPLDWAGRYIMVGVTPFIFFLSLLSKSIFASGWEKKFYIPVGIFLLWFYFVSGHALKTYWAQKQSADPTDRWVKLKQLIKQNDAYGKIHTALGIVPNRRVVDQMDVNKQALDATWQIYTGGIHSTSSILLYDKEFYGGRKGFPCNVRDLYPVATGGAKSFVIDFCEKEKTILRVLEK